jgi:SAM-dependent methyltransferase
VPPDRELWLGSRAHYADGALYDHLYRRRREDVRWYAKLAREDGGPVLELGSGTGRVSLAIAKAGVRVVGVDLSRAMIERAETARAKLPAKRRALASFRPGDFRSLRLGRRFPLVIAPFNALQHCYDRADWEAALATVRRHLTRRGRFVFDVLLPDPIVQARNPARRFARTRLVHPTTRRPFVYTEGFVHERQRQLLVIYQWLDDEADSARRHVVPIAHRQIYPLELEALLHYNGFTIRERYGDFSGGAPSEASESQIVVCTARTSR